MARLLALVLVLLLIALQWRLWEGEGGRKEVAALQVKVEQQRTENEGLKIRNEALAAEVEDLRAGEAAIEERARAELGMIKPGEVFYRIVEPAHVDSDPSVAVDAKR